MPKRTPAITAAIAADLLGINRTRDGDLRPMVKALGLMAGLNTVEENRRREVASWALRNWTAYQEECSRRRDLKSKPVSPLDKATRALVAEVHARLYDKDDREMREAVVDATAALRTGRDIEEATIALLDRVDAVLDEDAGPALRAAAEAVRELLPAPSTRP